MGYAKYTEDLLEDTPALQDYYFGYSTSNVTNDYSLSSSYIGSLKCEKSKKKEDIPEFLEIYRYLTPYLVKYTKIKLRLMFNLFCFVAECYVYLSVKVQDYTWDFF